MLSKWYVHVRVRLGNTVKWLRLNVFGMGKYESVIIATACRVIQTPVRSVCGGQRAHVAPSGVLGVFQAYPPRVHCQPRRLAPRR